MGYSQGVWEMFARSSGGVFSLHFRPRERTAQVPDLDLFFRTWKQTGKIRAYVLVCACALSGKQEKISERDVIDPLWNIEEWKREEVEENPLKPRALIEYD